MSDRFDEPTVHAEGQRPPARPPATPPAPWGSHPYAARPTYGQPPTFDPLQTYDPQHEQRLQQAQQYLQAAGPPGYGRPHEPPGLPSTATTIVITALFGLFGLIPAAIHSKRAEQMGVPGNRYWKAFGITFAIAAAVYTLLIVLMFAFVFSVADTVG